ncbi:MAG: precorrin-2 C(20)-methyltransferase [Archaeoglobaceae archaeon]
MLYGVSLGPGDVELLTFKAVRIIREADEVIVPGEVAAGIVRGFREPKIVEFPMGKGREVAKKLASEIVERCARERIAFCCLGDATLYSTFSQLAEEVLKLNPKVEIEIVPGVSSVFAALAKMKVFVTKSILITTDFEPEVVAVMKAKRSREISERLKKEGYGDIRIVQRLYMDGEKISEEIPDFADYLSIIVGVKR